MVEKHHHELATAGQAETDLRDDTLTHMADKMMPYWLNYKRTREVRPPTVAAAPYESTLYYHV